MFNNDDIANLEIYEIEKKFINQLHKKNIKINVSHFKMYQHAKTSSNEQGGVYCFYENNQVSYVGRTNNLHRRLSTHMNSIKNKQSSGNHKYKYRSLGEIKSMKFYILLKSDNFSYQQAGEKYYYEKFKPLLNQNAIHTERYEKDNDFKKAYNKISIYDKTKYVNFLIDNLEYNQELNLFVVKSRLKIIGILAVALFLSWIIFLIIFSIILL